MGNHEVGKVWYGLVANVLLASLLVVPYHHSVTSLYICPIFENLALKPRQVQQENLPVIIKRTELLGLPE